MSSTSDHNSKIQSTLQLVGFTDPKKIAETLQGSVWQGNCTQSQQKKVIKLTNKYLHKNSISVQYNGEKQYKISENILMEQSILKFLSKQTNAPKSIIKYENFFKSNSHYYLVMEHGGRSLFNFIIRGHTLIESGNIDISEWHRVIKKIFTQLIECVEFIHSNNICHFDLSLENLLINDLQINETRDSRTNKAKITFVLENLQIKLVDFGLAEYFAENNDFASNKHCGKSNYQSPEINEKKKGFDARMNDIWCLCVSLFMMSVGVAPFKVAHKSDRMFVYIINGHTTELLTNWKKAHYVTLEMVDLMESIFKYENERATLHQIKKHPWLNVHKNS